MAGTCRAERTFVTADEGCSRRRQVLVAAFAIGPKLEHVQSSCAVKAGCFFTPWMARARRAQIRDSQTMHDIRQIRDNPEAFDEGLKKRGLAPMAAQLIALDDERKAAIQIAQDAQERDRKSTRLNSS